MTGYSHLIFGVGSGAIATVFSPSLSFIHLPLIGFSSLLSDIDSSTSKLGRKAKWVGKLFGHRGFFHTPFFASLFLLIPDKGIRYSFLIGILSHLFLDMMNRGGVPLLWPFSKKKFKIANLKCGSWGEGILVVLFLLVEAFAYILIFHKEINLWEQISILSQKANLWLKELANMS